MEREIYLRPEIGVAVAVAERGFAASVEAGIEGFEKEEWNE